LPARLTANLLNRYVAFLGYDALKLEQRPMLPLESGPRPVFPPRAVPRGGPQLSEQQSTYDQDYYTDWIRAFLDLVERNSRSRDGGEGRTAGAAAAGRLSRIAVIGPIDRLQSPSDDPVSTPASWGSLQSRGGGEDDSTNNR
jgi:hypothetical protein